MDQKKKTPVVSTQKLPQNILKILVESIHPERRRESIYPLPHERSEESTSPNDLAYKAKDNNKR